ncbi:MAG: hypothetical protein AB7R89_14060 [Dehalococcoidia bacterium]
MTTNRERGVRYGQLNREVIAGMLALPAEEDGPVYMVNLMKYRARADYTDERGDQITGREADDRYSPRDILAEIGARTEFYGDVVAQPGGGAPIWDRCAIVRYPTRAAFFAMQRRPDFQARHVHKDAGMEQTIVLATVPDGTARRDLPRTDTDDVVAVEVMPAGGPGRSARGDGRAGLVLRVEGEVIGDGRQWQTVCLIRVSSADAAALNDGDCIREGYLLIVRPSIDQLTRA